MTSPKETSRCLPASSPLAAGAIVYINGWPGVLGKYTIARQLVSMLGPDWRLVHNHLLIDPAEAALGREESGYQVLRKSVRSSILDFISGEHVRQRSFIFTDFQTSSEQGTAVGHEYAQAAKKAGRSIYTYFHYMFPRRKSREVRDERARNSVP